jgi:DNA-binding LytR/AlgR family response regulator
MEAMKELQSNKIDLMFLDIQMPDLTGVELLKSINHKPAVIFTTAYKEYALEGYELDIIDYLLKPISFERFTKGVNKAIDFIQSKETNLNTVSTVKIQKKDHINIKADHKIYKVKLTELKYIEGLGEYVTYHTSNKKIVSLASLKQLEKTLPSMQFIRVHKSFIVNLDFVSSLYGNRLELGEKMIPIGRSFRDNVRKVFEEN